VQVGTIESLRQFQRKVMTGLVVELGYTERVAFNFDPAETPSIDIKLHRAATIIHFM
jgi:hypothetical protein